MPDDRSLLLPSGPAAGATSDIGRSGYARFEIATAPDGTSFLKRQAVRYPFHVCRPFRLDGDPFGMVTIYLQSCAGGIFDGDDLHQLVSMGDGARAHITTQAATIVHDSSDNGALQTTELTAGAGSILEFMPDPLILFPGARLQSRLRANVDPTATVILSDSFIVHDPKGEDREFRSFLSEADISISGLGRVALDRYEITGKDLKRREIGANGDFMAQGSLMILDGQKKADAITAALQQELSACANVYAMASTLPRRAGSWVRILARDAVALRRTMEAAWMSARQALVGARPPRRRK